MNGTDDVLDPDAEKFFGPRLDLMRTLHQNGLVSLEGEWGMDKGWETAPWKGAWLRLKLDAMVMHDKTTATVIDYKTGRRFGNEVKHAEQLQLYQLVTFLRYPQLETVFAELWYLDQKDGENLASMKFTRSQGLRYRANFERRGIALTTAEMFPANPNRFTCKWCPYLNTEHCDVGVSASAFPKKIWGINKQN